MSALERELDTMFRERIGRGDLDCVAVVAGNRDHEWVSSAWGERAPGVTASADSVGAIMSMTKAVTGAAAMQLVEQGRLSLDAPAGDICPYLGDVQVLDRFDESGNPVLRPPTTPVTLRNLLTHTCGFAYDIWNADLGRFIQQAGIPSMATGQKRSLELPLMFDPDSRWEYGVGIDWAGQMIEAVTGTTLGAYCREHLFEPLGMRDTGYAVRADMQSRRIAMRQRLQDGSIVLVPESPTDPDSAPREFEAGGAGLLSTMPDYARFLRMILRGGELDGVRVLGARTVADMGRNHIGDLRVTKLPTAMPALSCDAEFFPGEPKTWGLTFQINEQPAATGRAAGTLMWAGLANSYFWIDPERGCFGTFMTQMLPFADPRCVDAFMAFEAAVYRHM